MRQVLLVAAAAALLLLAGCAAAFPTLTFPLYKQCDPRWGGNEMGIAGPGERATICQEGCAMSCVSMALAAFNVTINGTLITPGSLNQWLKTNNGYTCIDGDCNNLVLDAPERLIMKLTLIGETEKPALPTLVTRVTSQREISLLHVNNRSHFVLATGYLGGGVFQVNDPFFNRTSYNYSEVADVLRYTPDWYPRFFQCDPAWGSNPMGTNGQTICQVGCLMSSISSALQGTGIAVGGQLATPATLNAWLRANGGYVSGTSDLMESAIPKISPLRIQWNATTGMHLKNDIPFATIRQWLELPVPPIMIANVMQGQHFVLVVGARDDNSTLIVNDSGFVGDTYEYSTVVGWRIFSMH